MSYLYGTPSLVFGVPGITGYLASELTISSKPGIDVTVQNESGQIVYRYTDDVQNEVSFNATFAGASLPQPGAVFTANGVNYMVQSLDVKYENKGFQTVSIKGISSQYLTISS